MYLLQSLRLPRLHLPYLHFRVQKMPKELPLPPMNLVRPYSGQRPLYLSPKTHNKRSRLRLQGPVANPHLPRWTTSFGQLLSSFNGCVKLLASIDFGCNSSASPTAGGKRFLEAGLFSPGTEPHIYEGLGRQTCAIIGACFIWPL